MADDNTFYDLYLYIVPQNDKLFKIPHLTREDADKYAQYWFDMNEMHDYMLVTENSTPWSEPAPSIEIKTPEWITLEYAAMYKV